MANLTHGSTKWSGSQTQTKPTTTYTFPTEGQYVDKNIELQVTVDSSLLASNVKITPTNATLSASDSNPSAIKFQAGGDTKYLTGVTLGTGKKLDVTNDVTDKVTIEYDSTVNAINFVFD